VVGFLLLLTLGLMLLWAVVVAWTAWMLTHPPRRTYASAVARGLPGTPSELRPARTFESWTFSGAGIDLPVWDIVGDDPAGPVVILTHGWASSRVGMLPRAMGLAPMVSRLVLWDLPGHGEAPGRCSLGRREAGSLHSLLDEVKEPGGPPLVLCGASLGAGVSLEVAGGRDDIAAVIAEAPYRHRETPARNVLVARGLPHRFTLGPALALTRCDVFDRARDAANVRCPVLVLHGSQDMVSPGDDGRAIAAATPRGTYAEIDGAGHNDLWTTHAAASAQAVRAFLDGVQTEARPGATRLTRA
jgi:pimeloyl-ACP methyl ester carboxylesterase